MSAIEAELPDKFHVAHAPEHQNNNIIIAANFFMSFPPSEKLTAKPAMSLTAKL
ncbi:MAG: hypothetical protein IKQ95_07035 [Synergistaceae bacterium]|nr:hypothetical protein [Synergistaceae bacterium]